MQKCREHIFSFLPKSSSLLIEKINREIFLYFFFSLPSWNTFFLCACSCHSYSFILHLGRSSYGEVEPLNLELDSVNQFSFLFFLFYIIFLQSDVHLCINMRASERRMNGRRKEILLDDFKFIHFFPIPILIQFFCFVLLFFENFVCEKFNSGAEFVWIFRDYPDLWHSFFSLFEGNFMQQSCSAIWWGCRISCENFNEFFGI